MLQWYNCVIGFRFFPPSLPSPSSYRTALRIFFGIFCLYGNNRKSFAELLNKIGAQQRFDLHFPLTTCGGELLKKERHRKAIGAEIFEVKFHGGWRMEIRWPAGVLWSANIGEESGAQHMTRQVSRLGISKTMGGLTGGAKVFQWTALMDNSPFGWNALVHLTMNQIISILSKPPEPIKSNNVERQFFDFIAAKTVLLLNWKSLWVRLSNHFGFNLFSSI